MTKICPMCGKEFERTCNSQVYCSKECRKRADNRATQRWKKRRKEPLAVRACEECGKPFMPKRSNAACCSKECYEARQRRVWREYAEIHRKQAVYIKTCEECGRTFETKNPQVKYCCVECRKRGQRNKFKLTVNSEKAFRTTAEKAQTRKERNEEFDRARCGEWYGLLVDKNREALEKAPSYGKAYAPKVEVYIPARFRR